MEGARTIIVLVNAREALEKLLEPLTEQGLQVRFAASHEEVMAILETSPPALALLEIRLGGLELCRRLKSGRTTWNLPILLLSEGCDSAERIRAFEVGADDFLSGSFQGRELLTRVRTYLELARLRNELERRVADKTRDLELTNAPLRAEAQELGRTEAELRESERNYHLAGICMDMTRLQRAEEAQKASDARFTQLFRNMSEGLAYCRMVFEDDQPVDWIYLDINPSFERLVHLQDAVGKRVSELLPGIRESNPELFEIYGRVARGGAAESFETYVPGLDSWFAVSAFCPKQDSFVAIFQIITERKRAEEALRESERRYRSIIRTAMDGFWLLDQQGRLLQVNEAYSRMSGYDPEELLGMTVADLDVVESQAEIQARIQRGVSQGSDRFETRHRRKDGSPYDLEISGQYLSDGSGHMVAFLRDITERKRGEEERRRLAERISQVQKLEALGVLVAGVAHNLNNVLAAIMGAASLREKLATEAKDLEAYRIITMACRRGRDVVRSLTQFAQPTLSSREAFEVHGLVAEVRTLLESTTRNRIQILEAFSPEPLWMVGDVGNLNHALVNLCLNALDAMPGGGTIVFRTAGLGPDWLELAVEDSGEGMAPEILARVTEPFFSTKPVGKGTGLGLSMTHGVVKAHGGSLEILSAPGQGTTVKLKLPRIPAPDPVAVSESAVSASRALRVLLVDDDEDVRFLVARMLKLAGFQIESVAGGEEALEVLASKTRVSPDLIILDQNMPRMDGIQTMERIRALGLDIPILISSGQPDIQEWTCFRQPNIDIISKPFELDELLAKLDQVCREPRP